LLKRIETIPPNAKSICKVKNTVRGEEEVPNGREQDYGFIDAFLKEAVNTSNIYESQQEADYD
jgi:hypothetical protein